MAYADLELSLHRREGADYAVELRFSQPDSEVEVRPITGDKVQARIDLQQLRQLMVDDRAYGQNLSDGLFGADAVRSAFAAARAAALSQEQSLRLRLFIGPSAPELHNVRWETLLDPERAAPLLTGENLVFSRYLSAEDWRPVRLRPKTRLNALVVVANPSNLSEYNLAPVDVAGELGRARQALDQVTLTELVAPGQATLNAMVEQLRQGYDILYLTAHGAQVKDQSWLYLEKPDGSADVVAGSELATRINELSQRPRLVVLASCQSAGTGQEASSRDDGVLAALGPRLAAAGVPAVVAMQGNVSMQTTAEFMPVFFRELQRDGLVDRAMSVARGAVRKQPDWWTPALFMRLADGQLFAPDPLQTFDPSDPGAHCCQRYLQLF